MNLKFSAWQIILFCSTAISLLYFSWDINSWKFSYVGDEWTFYSFAKHIVDQNFFINPFSMQGVYQENPALGSIYQALFLEIFAPSNFAWRFSNIILIIPCSIFFFLWLKKLFNLQIAAIGTILLQSSSFISNYFKIGYVNPISFTLFLLSLYLATVAGNSPTRKHMIFLGICLGVSFYIYLGPLFLLFIWPLLLPALKTKKHFFINIIYFLLSYIAIIMPGLFDMTHWHAAAKKTIFIREFHDNMQIVTNIFHNFLLFYKNYDYMYNHFIAGPYLDVITRIFAFFGTIIVILNLKRNNFLLFLLTYLSVIFVIGFTSPYAYAPTTRGIFFIPFACIFAAIPLSFLFRRKYLNYIVVILLIVIFFLNIYQSQIGVFQQTGYTATSLIIKDLQEEPVNQYRSVFLVLSEQQHYNTNDIFVMQKANGLESVRFYPLAENNLRCETLSQSRILYFDIDTKAKEALNKFSCPKSIEFSVKSLSPKIFL